MGTNMILISGGPGLYNPNDTEHDQGWANYVTPPLLMTDSAAERSAFEIADEVWWFVFKPAYLRRWTDDLAAGRSSAQDVLDEGFTNYANKLEARATSRGWQLRWFDNDTEFWQKMANFNDPIKHVIYWGHASDDLWLSVRHNSNNEAIAPVDDEVIRFSDIDAYANQVRPDGNLMRQRYPVDANNEHMWIGCNTDHFAQEWSRQVRVWSKGVEGKVQFASIFEAGHMPSLSAGATVKRYNNSGVQDSSSASW